VEALCQAGAKVAIIDVNEKTLDACVKPLRAKNYDVYGFSGDIVPKADAIALFNRAAEHFGRIHGLVNCAGVYPRRPILEIADEDWDFDWKVNVRGTYNMMAAAVLHMRKQPLSGKVRGRIVNVSSVDAFKAHPKNAHYAATKAAVVSLTRSFALEFAPDQILVNAIAPAGIATEKAKGAGFLPELASHTPLDRNAEPDEIANWIAILLDERNSYMTGETVIVSGGYIFA
jgi:NAD(P)-dependent dehydrogenase (short-subunit alcohol dehydrogenase family)